MRAHSYAPRLDTHWWRRPGELAIAHRPTQPRPRLSSTPAVYEAGVLLAPPPTPAADEERCRGGARTTSGVVRRTFALGASSFWRTWRPHAHHFSADSLFHGLPMCSQFSEATKKPQARQKVRFLTAFSVNHFTCTCCTCTCMSCGHVIWLGVPLCAAREQARALASVSAAQTGTRRVAPPPAPAAAPTVRC